MPQIAVRGSYWADTIVKGRVLVIAGSDSGGGAGIQADIKTITALGGYAATAITALTAQNTRGVHAGMVVPLDFLRAQMECVLADIGADAIKTGMLGDEAVVALVAEIVSAHREVPLVLDPVLRAKGGHALLSDGGAAALRRVLLPLATVVTPNLPEAATLTGQVVETVDHMECAAQALLRFGARAVLVKGGHLPGAVVADLLATAAGMEWFESARVETVHTHGTGCTLASAIAAGIAQGMTLRDAVVRARAYVQAAIAAAPGFGAGHGPLNHAVWLGRVA